jgi:hypothetical protein
MSNSDTTVSKGQAEIGDNYVTSEQIVPSISRKPFRRRTLFQILVVGICAFCAPGIWSAMNGLGVGGSQSPDLVNGKSPTIRS